MKKQIVLFAVVALLMTFIWSNLALAQGGQNFDAVNVEVKKVQGNVYMLTGAGGNVTVQVGD